MTQTQRESMVFYDSFFEAIVDLPAEEFKKCACAILGYGLRGEMPETTGIEKTIFVLAKPQIDKNNQRWQNAKKSHSSGNANRAEQNDENLKNDKKKTDAKTERITASKSKNERKTTDADREMSSDDEQAQDASYLESLYNCVPDEPEDSDFYEKNDTDISKGNTTEADGGKASYGEYNNVKMTVVEKILLANELGYERAESAITFLSRYIARKPGYSSASHFEDLRGWVNVALDERKNKSQSPSLPRNDYYDSLSFDDICEKP